jgi:hypothetical protein
LDEGGFSGILRQRRNNPPLIAFTWLRSVPISIFVEAYAETGANRSRSPDYDRGTDATIVIKED